MERGLSEATGIDDRAIARLRDVLRGTVISPGDADDGAARPVENGALDRAPAVVACCGGVADVVAALRWAAQRELPIAVRGGGGPKAGSRAWGGGIVIDCSPMRGVLVDPAGGLARAQSGVSWAELDRETQVFGLATTGGPVSTAGVADSALGGGFGWLMRKHGLAGDNLVAVEMVTLDGEVVRASDDEHAELFWALRSGGGTFGVVTSLEFRLHPVGTVVGGTLLYPADAAGAVYAAYAELAPGEPDELCSVVAQRLAPDAPFVPESHRGRRVVAVTVCYAGPLANGDAAIRRWRRALPVLADLVKPMGYTAIQSVFDEQFPPGVCSQVESHAVDDLGPGVVDALVAAGEAFPTAGCFLNVCHLEGALSRRPSGSVVVDHQARYRVAVGATGRGNSDLAECVNWARATRTALAPYATVGAAGRAGRAGRLAALRRRFDPSNRFCSNENTAPSGWL